MALAVQLGMNASGGQALESYTPSPRMFSTNFQVACSDAPDISQDIPIPLGTQRIAGAEKRQPQLILSKAFYIFMS